MRANLLDTLLRFASGERATEEDPITETFAWLLAYEPVVNDCFCELIADTAAKRIGQRLELRRPSVRTQVVIPRVGGGVSRYDLLLDAGSLRMVVEVKVRSGLTPSAVPEPASAGAQTAKRHQIDEYLALTEHAPPGHQHFVIALAIEPIDVGTLASRHPRWCGTLTWQQVHDALIRCLRGRRGTQAGEATRLLAEQLLGVMEARGMATPRMTLDGALAIRRASRFRQAVNAALEVTWQELHRDGTLDGFVKIDRRAWQDEDRWSRAGFRLWALPNDTSHFGFIGIWHGDDTIVEDVPDLCFFLQVKPDGRAGEALREQAATVAERLSRLDLKHAPNVRWSHDPSPNAWQPIWCAASLASVILSGDPTAVLQAHFRSCIAAAREAGLLDLYFSAVKSLS